MKKLPNSALYCPFMSIFLLWLDVFFLTTDNIGSEKGTEMKEDCMKTEDLERNSWTQNNILLTPLFHMVI